METAQIQEVARNWSAVASTLVLILIRVSVVLAIGPLFSSRVFAARTKIVLAVLMTWLLVPVAMAQSKPPVLGVSSVLAELAVGGVYVLTLGLLSEILLLAGQVAGVQFSFSLVNLLDPSSEIQTPLLADLFQLFGLWILFTAGLDRVFLDSLIHSLRILPPGSFTLRPETLAHGLMPMLSGAFFAALQLTAPLLRYRLTTPAPAATSGTSRIGGMFKGAAASEPERHPTFRPTLVLETAGRRGPCKRLAVQIIAGRPSRRRRQVSRSSTARAARSIEG